jgi:hypothetical protein
VPIFPLPPDFDRNGVAVAVGIHPIANEGAIYDDIKAAEMAQFNKRITNSLEIGVML